MANRRGLAGFGAGAGEGLTNAGAQLGHTLETREGEKRRAALGMLKDLEDKVLAGTIEPEQADAVAAGRGLKVDPGYFTKIQAPVSKQLSSILDPIQKATSLDALPTTEGLNATMPKRIGQITTSNIPDRFRDPTQTEAGLDQLSPNAGLVADTLQAKRRSLVANIPPTKGDTEYDPASGATYRDADSRFNPLSQTRETFGDRAQVTPTPREAGYNKAEEEATQLRTSAMQGVPTARGQAAAQTATVTKQLENVLGMPAAEAAADNTKSDLTRGTRTKDAAAMTSATSAAAMPFQKAMAQYANDLAQGNKSLQIINDPNTGQEIWALMDKKGGTIPVQMPDGFDAGKGTKIPSAIIASNALLTTAEIESVKILRALRALGLDKSNDMVDPRLDKFITNVLKASPNDPDLAPYASMMGIDISKGGIQQRSGFVNAALTRALMGGRPSDYVAKIIQPHLIHQEMTGKRMYETLINTLTQTVEQRKIIAQGLGVPGARLEPRNEPNSYANYLRELGTPMPEGTPVQLTVDANGNLIPAPVRR